MHVSLCSYLKWGVSINCGTPKWMVYNGTSCFNWWFRGTTVPAFWGTCTVNCQYSKLVFLGFPGLSPFQSHQCFFGFGSCELKCVWKTRGYPGKSIGLSFIILSAPEIAINWVVYPPFSDTPIRIIPYHFLPFTNSTGHFRAILHFRPTTSSRFINIYHQPDTTRHCNGSAWGITV